MLPLKKEWEISAGSTGCVKDRATLGEKAQEFLYKLLVSRVAVQAVFLAIERGIAIIFHFAVMSHFFQPSRSVHFVLPIAQGA